MGKKILLIHHSGLVGGAGISLYNMWVTLEKQYQVVAYIADDPPALMDFLNKRGLYPCTFSFRLGKLTYYSGGNSLLKPRFWYHALHSLFQIAYWKKVIAKEQPDFIIVNSKVLCWMGRIFQKANIKSMCFVRETIPGSSKRPMNRLMSKMLDDFTLVAFLSDFDRAQTELQKAEMVVSPDYLEPANYIDKLGREAACQKLNINPASFNILFAGGIDELKGVDIAVQAINCLKNEDTTLVVAGKDTGEVSYVGLKSLFSVLKRRKTILFSKRIKETIEKTGLRDKIIFIGIQTDMSTALSACDVLIFPMKKPHQARPAFEIGVQKKPVIITDFPNIHEFVKTGWNGLTFQPGNPESLAEAILKLKNNPELLKEMGTNNYEYTMKYHTEEFAMSRLIEKINEVMK